ncbi:lytic transglycosylase domain-containing protein, partial [Yoonia sp.]
IALRYFDDATLALSHFDAMAAAVDTPISLGRAGYWRGRAYQALGDANAAALAYAEASDHQTSFYGLLAGEQLGMALDPALTGRADARDWQGADVLENELVIAALALLEAGERGLATQFFAQLGRQLDADDTGRLAALMEEMDQSYYAVLLGKAAAARGIIVPSAYFPMHGVADMDLPVEPALSLAIARRESEFNAGAGSPVGALGLMQLMPATAQEVAGFLDLPYSKARLTSDWSYNAQLGSKYLSVLQDQFGFSPVQIAAGYNAGPSRPWSWMDQRGDPRIGEADVVDWIEHIPFRETRNYVMRVTESIPVYRARLTGQTGPIAFTSLLVGDKPLVRPQIRPVPQPVEEPLSVSTSDAPSIATPAPIPTPNGVPGIRPISRPGN